ncbi:MAG: YkgJ family cysteine cluster protein [Candidatus Sumerlaeia bacterium]|nr:YkgJ family cysteine cluster protein [Candidatus Sumerlaeia bacterium]
MANPCLECGVCCTQFRVSFYWGEADDVTPGRVPIGLTERLGPHRLMMKGTGGSAPRCVALEGELCKSVKCGIHLNRPTPCRNFEASWANGQPHDRCDEARARFGLPPLRPEDWLDPIYSPVNPPPENDPDLPEAV